MKVKVKSLSHVQFFATPWTVAYQVPLRASLSAVSRGYSLAAVRRFTVVASLVVEHGL